MGADLVGSAASGAGWPVQSRFQMTVRRSFGEHIATQTEPALAKQKSMPGVAVIGCFAAL